MWLYEYEADHHHAPEVAHTVLVPGLGRVYCQQILTPYPEKACLEPEQSETWLEKRVSCESLSFRSSGLSFIYRSLSEEAILAITPSPPWYQFYSWSQVCAVLMFDSLHFMVGCRERPK